MPKLIYPLEGDKHDEARFYVYDEVGRKIWGQIRVRREKNPDVLVVEGTRGTGVASDSPDWKPILHLTGVGDNLLFRTFGMKPPETPEVLTP